MRQPSSVLAVAASAAALGALLLWLATPWGIGLSPDSAAYVGAARNLLAGRGLTLPGLAGDLPFTHYPPLYPALLALAGLSTGDPLSGGRALHALLWAANLFLIVWALAQGARRASWVAVAGALFALTAPTLVEIHLMAWSEPAFLAGVLLGCLLLAMYLDAPRWPFLLASALATSLALLTRYAGVALVGAGGLSLLLLDRRRWSHRLGASAAFGLISVLPLALWTLYTLTTAGRASSRELAFHPIGREQLGQALDTLAGWLLVPHTAPTMVKFGALIVAGAALAVAWAKAQALPPLVKVLGLFSMVYLAFLTLSISFFDANTPLDNRILSPLYAAGLIVALSVSGAHLRRGVPAIVALGIAVILAMASGAPGARLLSASYSEGLGFNSIVWRVSPTLAQIRALPADVPIYANAPEAITIHTGRAAARIPRREDATTRRTNPRYTAEMAALRASVMDQRGVVVYFTQVERRAPPTEEELRDLLSLRVLVTTADGRIYSRAGL